METDVMGMITVDISNDSLWRNHRPGPSLSSLKKLVGNIPKKSYRVRWSLHRRGAQRQFLTYMRESGYMGIRNPGTLVGEINCLIPSGWINKPVYRTVLPWREPATSQKPKQN